jgi:membrane protein implicated in regulation of membrane protease activity
MESVSPVLVWFLLGIAFFVTELAVPGFILFFLGIGAWCAAAVVAIFDEPLSMQLLTFLVSSLGTLIFFRSRLRSIFFGDSSEEDDPVDMNFTSSTGVVTEAIMPPAQGRVKYGGSYWQAEADEPINVDTIVHVVEIKDLVIHVRTLKEKKKK